MSKDRLALMPWVALLLILPWLAGCAGWTIHNESRAKLATQARQEYADAKVSEVANDEEKNLDYLLGQELKVVRDNSALQSDFAALEIASGTAPMAESLREGRLRMRELGFQDVKQLRDYLGSEQRSARLKRTLESAAKVLRARQIEVPDCARIPAEPGQADDGAKAAFRLYAKTCKDLIAAAKPPASGHVARATLDWEGAREELDKQEEARKAAVAEARKAGEAYRAVVAQNKSATTAATAANKDLQEKEAKLASSLETLKGLGIAGTFDESIAALVEVLSATASGAAQPSDPDLARATVVLKAIPALRMAAAELQDANKAIPVSGLLLELQRQTILADTAAKRRQLQEQRVAILYAKLDGYRREAQRWLAFSDALCNYAAGGNAGLKCDSFDAVVAEDRKVVCQLEGAELQDCALASSWKEQLRATGNPTARRELYKGAASYLQAIAAQAIPTQETFREIDVRHRETLLARRSAINSWNSVVSVPLDQLKAYYDGGIKPAELADLIVKALGFTAVAVGASK